MSPLVYRIRAPGAQVPRLVPNKTPTGRITVLFEIVELRSEVELREAFPVIPVDPTVTSQWAWGSNVEL